MGIEKDAQDIINNWSHAFLLFPTFIFGL